MRQVTLLPGVTLRTSSTKNRLNSAPGLEHQALIAARGSAAERFGAAGLVYVPVEHEDNQARAQEEVERGCRRERG